MIESIRKDIAITYNETRFSSGQVLEHYHDTCEIAFFVKADIQIFVKDKKYGIGDGDILFIDEYDIHRILYTSNTQYARYVINFRKDCILNVLRSLGLGDFFDNPGNRRSNKATTNLKQRNEMEGYFRLLDEADKKAAGIGTGESALAIPASAIKKSLLCVILAGYYALLHSAVPAKYMNEKDKQVKGIIDFIDSNYMNAISLDILAREFYLGKFHISRIFKEITGFSVMEYVQHRRVIEAQKMLRESKKDIASICYDCGFNNIQHFYLMFRKISNTTPLRYRKDLTARRFP